MSDVAGGNALPTVPSRVLHMVSIESKSTRRKAVSQLYAISSLQVNLYQCQSLRTIEALPCSLRTLTVGCPAALTDISAVS